MNLEVLIGCPDGTVLTLRCLRATYAGENAGTGASQTIRSGVDGRARYCAVSHGQGTLSRQLARPSSSSDYRPDHQVLELPPAPQDMGYRPGGYSKTGPDSATRLCRVCQTGDHGRRTEQPLQDNHFFGRSRWRTGT